MFISEGKHDDTIICSSWRNRADHCLFNCAIQRSRCQRQQCNESFSGIDVQLKLRQNLVPNLVDTVKGYASHEQETLDQVISARNSAMAANGPAEAGAAEGLLTGALGKLLALSEAYPDLKANTNFLQLQNELSQIEDKIAAARRFYKYSCWRF